MVWVPNVRGRNRKAQRSNIDKNMVVKKNKKSTKISKHKQGYKKR